MPGLDPGIQSKQGGATGRYYVYIMASRSNGTIYIGVTNDLARRVFAHKEGLVEGFSKRYAVKMLVYFEETPDVRGALQRERNLKHWSRAWKIALIEKQNPGWLDLYDSIVA
jgi:putative endonuclease